MRNKIFVDTSGYYSLLIKNDDMHQEAGKVLTKAAKDKTQFVTTDYVLDEIVTLLNFRKQKHLVSGLFESVFASMACRVEWMDQDRFRETKSFSFKYLDHAWSFTDCFSFVVMRELGLTKALTKDNHFLEAGFTPLLTH